MVTVGGGDPWKDGGASRVGPWGRRPGGRVLEPWREKRENVPPEGEMVRVKASGGEWDVWCSGEGDDGRG